MYVNHWDSFYHHVRSIHSITIVLQNNNMYSSANFKVNTKFFTHSSSPLLRGPTKLIWIIQDDGCIVANQYYLSRTAIKMDLNFSILEYDDISQTKHIRHNNQSISITSPNLGIPLSIFMEEWANVWTLITRIFG